MNVLKQINSSMMRLLLDATADAGGAGGGGAAAAGSNSVLTASGGGGGAVHSTGGTPTGTGAATEKAAATGSASPDQNTGGLPTTDWRSQLPKELQDSASLRKFTDLPALAGAYVNAEKLISQKGIPKPGANSTEADWQNVFKELGLPETVDKYDVKFAEGVSLRKDFIDEFKTNAHKAGILPKQAQAIADWFQQKNAASETDVKTRVQAMQTEQLNNLKTEWGQGYQLNLSRAQHLIKEYGDKDLAAYLDKTGLGNDVQFIKLLSKIGTKVYSEDKILGEAATGGAMTPSQAKQEISKIQTDTKHPYYIKDHPGHAAAVQEMHRLFGVAHPSQESS